MMQRSSVLAVALTLAVALAAPVAAGSLGSLGFSSVPSDSATAQTGTALAATQENNSTDNDSVKPGEKLAGVVSVQAAEVTGEVEERAFGHRIAAANSNQSKAAVIASESSTLEDRLSEIRSQQETLKEKYENGTISKGQYKARSAKLVAEARTIQRILNTTASTAKTLPSAALEDSGVSVQSINSLQESAKNLTGPAVSEMARDIAGNDVGKTPPGLSNKTPGNSSVGGSGNGVGENPGNGSGGAPGNGTPGNGTPGNGSAGTPGNGNSGNGTPGNGTLGNGTPGNGSNGLPGNGTNVSDPGNGTNVSDPGNGTNVSNPGNSLNVSNPGNSTTTSDSGNSSNIHLNILSALAVELDDSLASALDHF